VPVMNRKEDEWDGERRPQASAALREAKLKGFALLKKSPTPEARAGSRLNDRVQNVERMLLNSGESEGQVGQPGKGGEGKSLSKNMFPLNSTLIERPVKKKSTK